MIPNIPLMKRLRTRFLRIKHPEHFNMRPIAMKTSCGATLCIAGHTLVLAGYKMRKRKVAKIRRTSDLGRQDFDFIKPDGKMVVNPIDEAAKLLGIEVYNAYGNADEGFNLFHDFKLKTPKDAAIRIENLIKKYEPNT